MRPIEYLFFTLYRWQSKQWGDRVVAKFYAVGGIAFLAFFNLFGILVIVEELTGRRWIADLNLGVPHALAVMALLFGVAYLVCAADGRDKRIVRKFSGESPSARKVHLLFCLAYALASLAVVVAAGLLKR